jgi:hypothetical protein
MIASGPRVGSSSESSNADNSSKVRTRRAPEDDRRTVTDRVEDWDTSKWPRTRVEPGAEPEPECELSAADLLALHRDRAFERGREYAVFVESPFGEPTLRYRVCAEAGDAATGRIARFVTRLEWDEMQRAADRAEFDRRLAEIQRTAPKATPAAEALAGTVELKQVAAELSTPLETLKRRLRTAGVELLRLSAQDYRVRSVDLKAWLDRAWTDPEADAAAIDYCREANGQDPRRPHHSTPPAQDASTAKPRRWLGGS